MSAEAIQRFGRATQADLAELDRAARAWGIAQQDAAKARGELAAVMRRLLDKGAQRKAIAERVGVNDQTVSNVAYGRPPVGGRKEAARA
jgi:hypothetical protein